MISKKLVENGKILELIVSAEVRRVYHKRQGIPVILFKDADAIQYIREHGYKDYSLIESAGQVSNSADYSQDGIWKFEKIIVKPKKVVAKPKKRSYNSSKKKTVSVTPEE
jgi:hypothetical protein